MRGGMISSTLLHLAVLIVIAVGLPDFGRDLEVAPPIPVEIATIDDLTRPKPSKTQKPEPKVAEVEEPQEIPDAPPPPPRPVAAPPPPPEPAPEPQQQAALPDPTPPEPTPEPEPEPLPLPEPEAKPEPKEEVKEKPKPKPPAPRPNRKPQVKLAKKPEKKKEEPKEDRLASILNNVDQLKKEIPTPSEEKKQEAPQSRQQVSALDQRVTISEKDAIIRHVSRCWNVPAGARDAEKLIVGLRVYLHVDGTVQRTQIEDLSRLRDPFFRAAAEAADRAVRRCSPLPTPNKDYSAWRVMLLNFDPSEMLGQ
ncbi:MAG: energy transducer TonB [Kiloniellales bacterium]|nr:energy transducer TonB [Kiloniellales bacterium]